MNLIIKFFSKIIQKNLFQEEKESVRDILTKRIVSDSKRIIFLTVSLNTFFLFFVFSVAVAFYLLFERYEFYQIDPVVFSFSLVLLIFLIVVSIVVYIIKKFKVYQDILDTKEVVSNFNFLSPLVDEFHAEQVRMIKDFHEINHEEVKLRD